VIVDVAWVLAALILNPQTGEIVHTHSATFQTRDECRQIQAVIEATIKNSESETKFYLTECTAIPVRNIPRKGQE
jgi:hypothetical protein